MKLLTVADVAKLGHERKPEFNVPWRPALMKLRTYASNAARKTKLVEPCMLLAIVDRETGGRNVYQYGMPHGPGCGVGYTQITSGVDWSDPDHPKYPGYGDLFDPQVNFDVCAIEFLEPLLEAFPDNHLAAFAAYNLGLGGVQEEIARGESPDAETTGGDYGHAVFSDWINFTAASLGVAVDWSSWKA
jgi:hypothetical protein